MVGQQVSHYRILDKLGAGGMGVVYEAEDVELGRRVALKFLPDPLESNATAMERLHREARAASSLNHPNICTIYEIGADGDRHFIAMELLDGHTLTSVIAAKTASLDKVIEWSTQLADALDAAHTKGIIHRDIKPANVFVTSRAQAKLLDFGLAKHAMSAAPAVTPTMATAPPRHITDAGATVGTVAYMSPEQALGEELDPRTDIFSFGVVLYELLTGTAPFTGRTTAATFDAILHQTPTAPVRLNPSVPPRLEEIVNKCLEKDRELRYQTAAELRSDLKRLRRDSDSQMHRASDVARARSSGRRRWAWIAGAIIAASLLVLGAVRLVREPEHTGQTSVAVLPFQNFGSDTSMDFLKLALPDQVLTTLSYSPGLAVRPFQREAKTDAVAAGRDLRADNVITGHYLRHGDDIQVTLEAVSVKSNRVLWRDTVSGSTQNMIAMRNALADHIRQGLIAALGTRSGATQATSPTNPQAYDFVLRAAALSNDLEPNRQAIALLEQAVALDPGYEPAWRALANCYYYEAQYGAGGDAIYRKSEQALETARRLDPNDVRVLTQLTIMRAEKGELQAAYDDAQDLLRRRPDDADAHFAMAYLLRYAGEIEESAEECNRALARDPNNSSFRSCVFTYMLAGDYDRARKTEQVEPGSAWMAGTDVHLALHQNDVARAKASVTRGTQRRREWMEACVNRTLSQEQAEIVESRLMQNRDSEPKFNVADILAYCGQQEVALRLLTVAVDQGYCGVLLAERSPLMKQLRLRPEFAGIMAKGRACQQRFRDHRNQHSKPLSKAD